MTGGCPAVRRRCLTEVAEADFLEPCRATGVREYQVEIDKMAHQVAPDQSRGICQPLRPVSGSRAQQERRRHQCPGREENLSGTQGKSLLLPAADHPGYLLAGRFEPDDLALIEQACPVLPDCRFETDARRIVFAGAGAEIALATFATGYRFTGQRQAIGVQSLSGEVREQLGISEG